MKKLLNLFFVLIFTVAITSQLSAADKTPSDILTNAWNIDGKINFIATETTGMYVRDKFNVTISRVFSLSENKFRREYIFPPFLVGDLLIDDGTRSYYYQSQKKVLTISPSIFGPSQRESHNKLLKLILRNYNLVSSSDKYLGRDVSRISVYPADGRFPLLILWIDNQTNVILKREKYLPDGKIYEYSFYTDIDFNVIPNERLFVWIKPKEEFRVIEHKEKFIPLEEAGKYGPEIPYSFQKKGYECIGIKEVPGGIACQFSDGIKNFMVFNLESLPPIPPSSKKITTDGIRYSYWQIDSINGFAWNYKKESFLVIGMVERDIIEELIKSIR